MRARYIVLAAAGLMGGFIITAWWFTPRLVSKPQRGQSIAAAEHISLQFNQPIDEENIAGKLDISPFILGEITVEGREITFAPDSRFEYGTSYTITVERGIKGVSGLPSIKDYRSTFEIEAPALLYLKEEEGAVNLWIKEKDEVARQLTREIHGIWDYHVVPNGSGLIISSIDLDDSDDLVFIDREGGRKQLLQCVEVRCRDGRWQPGGTLVAYERQSLNRSLNAAEVWFLDVESGETWPAHNPVLFSYAGFDSLTSRFPRWSSDGRILAYHKPDANLIILLNLTGGDPILVPANVELLGEWSPAGSLLAYLEQTVPDSGRASQDNESHDEEGGAISLVDHLVLIDTASSEVKDLSAGQRYSDSLPTWKPDGTELIFGKETGGSRQMWHYDLNASQGSWVTAEPGQNHTGFAWSPDALQVAFMLADQTKGDGPPDIWLLDPETGESKFMEERAFLPGWLP